MTLNLKALSLSLETKAVSILFQFMVYYVCYASAEMKLGRSVMQQLHPSLKVSILTAVQL